MVPLERLSLKEDARHHGEDHETYALLNYFQLHEREGPSVAFESYSVCRYLAAIFQEGDAPAEGYYAYQGPMAGKARLLQSQMAIPGEGHEDVAAYEQQHRIESIH